MKLVLKTKKQNKKLKSFINKRDKIKTELKVKTAETKEMTKRVTKFLYFTFIFPPVIFFL